MAETKTTKAKATKAAATEVKEPKAKKPATSKKAAPKAAKEEKAVKTSTKKATKATKETKTTKEVKVAKPAVTEATAKVLGLKVTPRKVRLVIDLVRGKDVDEALGILNHVHKDACAPIAKLIKSAAANAVNNFNMNGDKLYVASIMASDSFKMRRYLPRAKGSASGLVKRFSNVFVTLKERA